MGGQKYDRGIIREVPGIGVLDAWGDALPENEGYSSGCIFRRTNSTNSVVLFVNEGTKESASWAAIATV